jgi:UDP-N-acetylmuramoyl-L-alanyl-D-glutamate--2,6-diaminopimelate ligase
MTEISLKLMRAPSPKAALRATVADCRNSGSALLLQRAVQRRHMTPNLRQLLAGIDGLEIKGKGDPSILALVTDSRRVGPGSLFFALSGLRTDGHFFIAEAIDRGAVAVVCDKDCWVPPGVTLVRSDDLRALLATAAARFYGHPERALELTGLLGTSGKTVVSALLRHFFSKDDPVGLLGTIHYAVGNRTLPAHRTTPEPIELFGLLAQMKQQDCRRAILEVSSHGIDQKRVAGLAFRNLVLLNLTPEHLHYHGSLERYVALEQGFIEEQAPGLQRLVAGIDDPRVRGLIDALPAAVRARVLPFGCDPAALIRAEAVSYSERDTRFELVWPEGRVKLVSPLLGEFNLQNTLAAIACGYAEGIDPVRMGADLLSFNGVRGRMERVEAGQPFTVLIDYMHTEAAYAKGLDMVRSLTCGRLITVFGCGGDRDPATRPVIARIVAERSDAAIATADNPRNETIAGIFDHMRAGNEHLANLRFIDDRRAAIAAALEQARPGDTVLIAGKGHETFQEFSDCVVPFDDRAVAREIIRNQQWNQM